MVSTQNLNTVLETEMITKFIGYPSEVFSIYILGWVDFLVNIFGGF